jgi:hypothetical protein
MDIPHSSTESEKVSPRPPEGMESDLSKLANNLVTKIHVLMRI